MERSNLLAAVAVIGAILAAVVWYAASPAYAMNQLKNAAKNGDVAELESSIDFPKVRESLKTQIRALIAKEMAKPQTENNPFGQFGAMIAMGMVDGMVEGFVTPESMAAMVEKGKMTKPGGERETDKKAEPAEWDVERDGFSRFTATPKSADGKPGPSLIFERDGLGWKLAGLNLPPEPTKAESATAP